MSCSPASFQPCHSDGSNELHEYETMFDTHKEGKSKTFVCKITDCLKIFRYRSEIVRHVATHSAQRPYVCTFEFCKKTFKRTDALENHMRTHTKESPYLCEHTDCEATFTTKASLRYHLLKHKDEKTFKCTFPGCMKAFITSFQLKQHEKSSCVHQKVKNFAISDGTVKEAKQTSGKEPVIKKILKSNLPPVAQETEAQEFAGAEKNIEPIMPLPKNNIYEENLENIVTENEVLKRRLELSSKIIGLLQYKMQGEQISGPEYLFANRFPEQYLRMQFFNQQQQQLGHLQQQQQQQLGHLQQQQQQQNY